MSHGSNYNLLTVRKCQKWKWFQSSHVSVCENGCKTLHYFFFFLSWRKCQGALFSELRLQALDILREPFWGRIDWQFTQQLTPILHFHATLVCAMPCYSNWICHNRLASFWSTASKWCVHIKASRLLDVRSTRVQVIHSRIILLCYLWTIQRSQHLMCHRDNRVACGESSACQSNRRKQGPWAL